MNMCRVRNNTKNGTANKKHNVQLLTRMTKFMLFLYPPYLPYLMSPYILHNNETWWLFIPKFILQLSGPN